MMESANVLIYVTADEYLRREDFSPKRHEYVDGRLFAMSGTSRRHNVIQNNIYSCFRAHLRSTPCMAYTANIKVRLGLANSFYCPDVLVTCKNLADESVYTDSPALVVEVLSRSTAATDLREKVLAYRQIPSLNEYVIVYQSRLRVEVHRKDGSGIWSVSEYTEGTIPVLGLTAAGLMHLSLADVYENVDFKRQAVEEEPATYVFEEDNEW